MYRKEKDPITIYWAPFFEDSSALLEPDWNMLYQNPELLHLDLIYNKEKTSKNKSSFNCPAVNDRHSSSYVFKNNLRTTFGYDFSDVSNPIVQSFEGVHSDYYKQPNIVGSGYVRVSLKWVFFSEESVIAITNHPYAHRPTEYSINCLFPSGRYDISKWIRPVSMEVQTWDKKGKITINEGDPLFYLELITNRPVIMKRFNVNKALYRYIIACSQAASSYGPNKPLAERYYKFISTSTDKLVLREIKKNLIQ